MSNPSARGTQNVIVPETIRIVLNRAARETNRNEQVLVAYEQNGSNIEKYGGISIKAHGEYIRSLVDKPKFMNFVKNLIKSRENEYMADEVAENGIYEVLYDAWNSKPESKGSDIKTMLLLLLLQERNMQRLVEHDEVVEHDWVKQSLIDTDAAYSKITGLRMGMNEFKNYVSSGCVLPADIKGEFKEKLRNGFNILIRTRQTIDNTTTTVSVEKLLMTHFINIRLDLEKIVKTTADSAEESCSFKYADNDVEPTGTAAVQVDNTNELADNNEINSFEHDIANDIDASEESASTNTNTDSQSNPADADSAQYEW